MTDNDIDEADILAALIAAPAGLTYRELARATGGTIDDIAAPLDALAHEGEIEAAGGPHEPARYRLPQPVGAARFSDPYPD